VFGAEGPSTFDCSGLVQFVFAHIGIQLPRGAADQQRATTPVINPMPGDLVFYGRPAGHVGIYLGAGKMISAPHAGATVHVVGVGTPTNYGRVAGLGGAAAPALALVGDTIGSVTGLATNWLGGARSIALQTLAAGLGAGLIGLGLWRAVSTRPGR
jgi:hypothetical protein